MKTPSVWWVLTVSWVTHLLVTWAPVPTQGMTDSLVISVPGGKVRGTIRAGAVHFLGIPYGTAHRFQYPFSSVTSWSGTRNASHPGPQCPQQCPPVIRDLYCLQDNQMSESCLTLNIYRPAYNLPSGQAFPVMVYIHGGDFQVGSGGAPLYNGDYLARVGGVILVTINYRLGALGFLPIFNSYDDVIGNFGFRDQQMALQWVKNNIGKFDGDPGRVTLFGEEAGCQSVGLHLTSLTSDPLFHSAILHSCPFTLPFRGKNESHQMADQFTHALGCPGNDVSCLRGKSVKEILRAQKAVTETARSKWSVRMLQVWGPTVDKRNVYDNTLLQELTKGLLSRSTNKPVMLGVAAGEGVTEVFRAFPLPVSGNFFRRFVQSTFPAERWRQVAEAPDSPYASSWDLADARQMMARFLQEYVYVCPAHNLAWNLAHHSRSTQAAPRVWMYEFDPKVTWSPGGSSWPPGGESYCQDTACQGLDLQYVFHPPPVPEASRPKVRGLSRAMVFYWTNLARYHTPNRPTRDWDSSGPSVSSSTRRGHAPRLTSRGGRGGGGVVFPASSFQGSSSSSSSLFQSHPQSALSGSLSLQNTLQRLLHMTSTVGASPGRSPPPSSSVSISHPALQLSLPPGMSRSLSPSSSLSLPPGILSGVLSLYSPGLSRSLFPTGSSSGPSLQTSGVLVGPQLTARVQGGRFVGGSLLAHMLQRPSLPSHSAHSSLSSSSSSSRSLPRFVAWPAYVTQDPVTSSSVDVNATLVLTQPAPVARFSPFDNGCEFWEGVGFD